MKKVLPFLLGFALVVFLATWNFDMDLSQWLPQPTTAPTAPAGTTAPTPVPTTGKPTTPSPESTAPTELSTLPPETMPSVQELTTSAIVLSQQTEYSRNENGVVYFSYSYPNVRLFLGDESIGEAVTLDLLNRIESTRSKAESVREDASNVTDATYFYNVSYTPRRIDGGILSISAVTTGFSGAAHPYSTCTGITYDLTTGKALTLGDLLTDRCTPDVLCRLVVDALGEQDTGTLYSDYSLSVEDRFSGNYTADTRWYLSKVGLCFLFEPYEVGPYSSGIVTAVIPYGQLYGYLEDAWFPPEQIFSAGHMMIDLASDGTLEGYNALVEAHLEPNGDAYVIHTDGLIYDLTIRTIGTNGTVLFAADRLTPGTAIVLRTGSPGSLRISYTSGEETITRSCSPD